MTSEIVNLSPGARLENCIFHLLRLKGELSFYRKKSGREIDFILNKKNAFEVKRQATKLDFKKLKRLAMILGLKQQAVLAERPPFTKQIYPGFSLG